MIGICLLCIRLCQQWQGIIREVSYFSPEILVAVDVGFPSNTNFKGYL